MSALLANLLQHAQKRPDSVAYRAGGADQLTYRQLARRAAALADWLRRRLPGGATVLLASPNRIEYPIAFLGILAAGCSVCPVLPEAAEAEFHRLAADTHAAAVIGDERILQLAGSCIGVALPLGALPAEGNQVLDASSSGNLLLQSSGTTGMPKLLRRTGPTLDAVAQAIVQAIGFSRSDHVLMTLPLLHSYGLEHGLLAPVWVGSCVHLYQGLDFTTVRSELAQGGITVFPGVPSTFDVLSRIGQPNMAMPTLRAAYSAGGPLPVGLFEELASQFKLRVSQLYGSTEMGSVTYNAPADDFDPASVGRAMPGVEIRILQPDGPRHEGEVAVRAPWMFETYLGAPTALVDGFFPTGDLGYLDAAGRLFITGRIKWVVEIGGLKVNPLEVEMVLCEHPNVGACIVVPVRQSQTINRLKAIVTPRSDQTTVRVDELRRWAQQRLAPYKVPRLFEVRPFLPCSDSGKILRHLVEPAVITDKAPHVHAGPRPEKPDEPVDSDH